MSSNYHPVIVRDDRINSITVDLPVEVRKGGAQHTFQSVNASSATTTSVTYNVTVPSESVVIDRDIRMEATFKVKIDIPNANQLAVNAIVFNYGKTDALQAFPFNSLINTASLTVNSSTISVNTQDIMGPLLQMYEQSDFNEYYCPTLKDKKMKKFEQYAILDESNPLGHYVKSIQNNIPRGSHPIKSLKIIKTPNGAGANAAVTLANTAAERNDALKVTHVNDKWAIELEFTTVEPVLFLSPLIFSNRDNNKAGFYGVNHLDFQFNLDTAAKRVFSSGSTADFQMSLIEVKDCKLLLNYITPQASDLINSRNVLPYVDYQRYLKSAGPVNPLNSTTIYSDSIQLNSVPSKFYVCVRKVLSSTTSKDSNSFLPITKCNINFNNMSGLLSSASQHDLYLMSKRNGLKQDVYEFFGKATVNDSLDMRPTIGSVLVIDACDLGLSDYLAPNSMGNFNFQINLTVENTDTEEVATEILIITQNDGIFVTENGQSSTQKGLLSKQMVTDATTNQFGESRDYVRKFSDGPSLTNVPFLNMSKDESGSGVKSGGAYSGGAFTAGAMSGGAMTAGNYTREALRRLNI